jgi:hypothetical protein
MRHMYDDIETAVNTFERERDRFDGDITRQQITDFIEELRHEIRRGRDTLDRRLFEQPTGG